jgi:hypothetical protein
MGQVFWDWEMISKTIVEKAFINIWSGFPLKYAFVSKDKKKPF